jgi:hypothetical protein
MTGCHFTDVYFLVNCCNTKQKNIFIDNDFFSLIMFKWSLVRSDQKKKR